MISAASIAFFSFTEDNYRGLAGGTRSESSKRDIEFETMCDREHRMNSI